MIVDRTQKDSGDVVRFGLKSEWDRRGLAITADSSDTGGVGL